MNAINTASPRATGLDTLNVLAQKAKNRSPGMDSAEIHPNPADQHEPFPLSDMQEAYWLGRDTLMRGGGVAMQSYVELDCGLMDTTRLQQAVDTLVARHDMLRAVLTADGRQRVLPLPLSLPVFEEDLSGLEQSECEARLADIAARMRNTISDLTVWPQSEIRFSRTGTDGTGRLHLRFDQWAMDGQSFQIVLEELAVLYANPDTELLPLGVSFRDYLLKLEEVKNSAEYRKCESYWREKLVELADAPPLPARPPAQQQDGGDTVRRISDELSANETQVLKNTAASFGLSVASVLGAVYGEILAYWSGRERFTLNIPRFNRDLRLHPNLARVVGEFATFSLVEYDDLDGKTFADRAGAFQNALWRTHEYGRVSGMKLLRDLAGIKGSMEAASMPVVFTAMPDGQAGNGDISQRLEGLGRLACLYGSTPQVNLDCIFSFFAEKLQVCWDVRTSAFPDGMPDNMFAEYMRIVRLLTANMAAWDKAYNVALPVAQSLVRSGPLEPGPDLSGGDLLQLFARQTEKTPQAPAVLFSEVDGRDGSLSYATLASAVLRVRDLLRSVTQFHQDDAEALAEATSEPTDNARGRRQKGSGDAGPPPVALLMRRGPGSLAGALGIMAFGRPFLPLDPSTPPERLRTMLDIAEPSEILTDAACAGILSGIDIPLVTVDAETDTDAIPMGSIAGTLCARHEAAYVMMTSGTTGLPKAVTVGHKGLLNAVLHSNRIFAISSVDRFAAMTAIHHDMALYDIFGALTSGAAVVLLPQEHALDPEAWADAAICHGITVWNSVPRFHASLMEHCVRNDIRLPIRLHILGGDWVHPDTAATVETVCPGAQVWSCGGPTETTLWNILHRLGDEGPGWDSVPYGRAVPGNIYYVLDAHLREAPDWTPGEMCCAGLGVCLRTTGDVEETNRFVAHPRTGERLYKTGDLGRFRPDGLLEILGRIDSQINIGGYRFNPAEVETALCRHEGVESATLVSVPGGPDDSAQILGACVTPGPVDEQTLVRYLQRYFPMQMIPRCWLVMPQVPLTVNGKVDRKILADKVAEKRCESVGAPVPPQTPLERLVAGLWADILSIDEPHLQTDFFRSGGDSIKAMRIIGSLKKTLGVGIPLTAFFVTPTIRGIVDSVLTEVASLITETDVSTN